MKETALSKMKPLERVGTKQLSIMLEVDECQQVLVVVAHYETQRSQGIGTTRESTQKDFHSILKHPRGNDYLQSSKPHS